MCDWKSQESCRREQRPRYKETNRETNRGRRSQARIVSWRAARFRDRQPREWTFVRTRTFRVTERRQDRPTIPLDPNAASVHPMVTWGQPAVAPRPPHRQAENRRCHDTSYTILGFLHSTEVGRFVCAVRQASLDSVSPAWRLIGVVDFLGRWGDGFPRGAPFRTPSPDGSVDVDTPRDDRSNSHGCRSNPAPRCWKTSDDSVDCVGRLQTVRAASMFVRKAARSTDGGKHGHEDRRRDGG